MGGLEEQGKRCREREGARDARELTGKKRTFFFQEIQIVN